MTKEEIEVLVSAMNRKTPISVYDSDGDLVTFFREDLISIDPPKDYRSKSCYLTVNGIIHYPNSSDNDLDEGTNFIKVSGTVSRWKKLLNFESKIINPID